MADRREVVVDFLVKHGLVGGGINSIEPLMSANSAVTVLSSPSVVVWESTCAAMRTTDGEDALAGSRWLGAAASPGSLLRDRKIGRHQNAGRA